MRGFEAAMTAHKRKRKDAEANGDKDEVERVSGRKINLKLLPSEMSQSLT